MGLPTPGDVQGLVQQLRDAALKVSKSVWTSIIQPD